MIRPERYDDPRRRQLLQALAAGAFSLSLPGAGALAAELLGGRPAKLPPEQSIYRMTGAVTVNGTPATMQTRVASKDTIETGRNGEVVFVAGESAFVLRSESRMTLEADEKSLIVSGLTLFTGKLLSVFPPAKNPSQAQKQMRTRTATVGVRGTGVYLESDPEQTYFCTCYGIADVSSNTDAESKETVVARQHDKPVYIVANAQRGQAIRPAPFINHTDQELMVVEALVGRTTPFVFPKESYKAPRREY